MNKALTGNKQEIIYTKQLNRKDKFWKDLSFDIDTTYAVHIISKKYGAINEAKIQPKADIILAKGNIQIDYLLKSNFYLNENDIKKLNLTPIKESGISVKLPNSRYTITKISPNTFIKIFGSNLLAAGASIYCNKVKDFDKMAKRGSHFFVKANKPGVREVFDQMTFEGGSNTAHKSLSKSEIIKQYKLLTGETE